MARLYQLHKNYEKFTGILGGVYACKNGIVTLPDGEKDPKPLMEHYGAVRIKSDEEKKAEEEARAKIEAEVRAKIAAEDAAKKKTQ